MDNICLYLYQPQEYLNLQIAAGPPLYDSAFAHMKSSSRWAKAALIMAIATAVFGASVVPVLTLTVIVATCGGITLLCALLAFRSYHLASVKIQQMHQELSNPIVQAFNKIQELIDNDSEIDHPSQEGLDIANSIHQIMVQFFVPGQQETQRIANQYFMALQSLQQFSTDAERIRLLQGLSEHFIHNHKWYKNLQTMLLLGNNEINQIPSNAATPESMEEWLNEQWHSMVEAPQGIYAIHFDAENNLILSSRNAEGEFGRWPFYFSPQRTVCIFKGTEVDTKKSFNDFKQEIGIATFTNIEY